MVDFPDDDQWDDELYPLDEYPSTYKATIVLSLLMWMKVAVSNVVLGVAKMKAGTCAPEDTRQNSQEDVSDDAKENEQRAQRIVNNDLENVPYTMILAFGSMFCIISLDSENLEKRQSISIAHIILFSLFVTMRIAHTITFAYKISKARSVVWLIGFLCSFGIAIVLVIAAVDKDTNYYLSSPTNKVLPATAILSLLLWMKVAVTNVGLGGAKNNAGTRSPEDTYQNSEDVSEDAKEKEERSQRIVNNDLENIPYAMILAWGFISSNVSIMVHIILFSLFVIMRFAHTITYACKLSTARSVVWFIGFLCTFGIAINGVVAVFQSPY